MKKSKIYRPSNSSNLTADSTKVETIEVEPGPSVKVLNHCKCGTQIADDEARCTACEKKHNAASEM